jgi:hypothetical protein
MAFNLHDYLAMGDLLRVPSVAFGPAGELDESILTNRDLAFELGWVQPLEPLGEQARVFEFQHAR